MTRVDLVAGTMPSEEKKKKRKRREREEKAPAPDDDADTDTDADESPSKNDEKDERTSDGEGQDEKQRKLDRKRKKSEKKSEKASLLEQVPKVDEHGISFTKIQIRRMTRRVKRGLPPVPTEEEERERLKDIKKEKQQEEEELSGMIFDRENEADRGGEDEGAAENDGDEDDTAKDEERASDAKAEEKAAENRPTKKGKGGKPVPEDYVCQACKNERGHPPHWIYNCPDKIRRPGTNQVKKNMKGVNLPDPRKVYVSGMPFGVKYGEVRAYFEDKAKCGKIARCHLVQFKDEMKRCKGEAFITFETEDGAKKAIVTSGDVMKLEDKEDKKGDKEGVEGVTEKKELRLKVTQVVNKVEKQRKNKYFSMMRQK